MPNDPLDALLDDVELNNQKEGDVDFIDTVEMRLQKRLKRMMRLGHYTLRATGQGADDLVEAVNNVQNNSIPRETIFEEDFDRALEDETETITDTRLGLTLQQKFLATQLLAKNVEDLDVFEGLPIEDKEECVKMMLVGKW
ncbi:hypothetical protein BUALT_Bualt13G0105400 [Buddleja alternifolia]|uniref:Uncharacterized protein n=1 Tax=Buddleja alternifolia TaxID=168488 RepID=A0AAV6WTP0_9LAMI|nr:hypothetical protein BUALT_Bualt13G0105400 [Buddleja alternifolia]